MADVRQALIALGVAPSRVHTEVFGTLAPINPGVVVHPPGHPTRRRARSGRDRW